MTILHQSIFTFALSFIVAIALVPVAIQMARRSRFLDHPNERKIHQSAIPLLGGLAVYIAASIGWLVISKTTSQTLVLLMAAGLMVLLGALDDRYDLSFRLRLAFQFVAAGWLVFEGLGPHLFSGWLDYIFALIWLVGVMNAMNCFDCADGVLGGTAGLALGSYGILLVIGNQLQFSLLSVAFSGACFGFLLYNTAPARIFLGDAGSTTLGLVLGALSLETAAHPLEAPLGWVAIIPIMLPIADFVLVHVRRYRNGTRNIRDLLASTGKNHMPHRLQWLGLSSHSIALVLYLITAGLCGAAVLSNMSPYGAAALFLLSVIVIAVVEYVAVTQPEAKAYNRSNGAKSKDHDIAIKSSGSKNDAIAEHGK